MANSLWADYIQRASYRSLTSDGKARAKKGFWDNILQPKYQRQGLNSFQIRKRKEIFFSTKTVKTSFKGLKYTIPDPSRTRKRRKEKKLSSIAVKIAPKVDSRLLPKKKKKSLFGRIKDIFKRKGPVEAPGIDIGITKKILTAEPYKPRQAAVLKITKKPSKIDKKIKVLPPADKIRIENDLKFIKKEYPDYVWDKMVGTPGPLTVDRAEKIFRKTYDPKGFQEKSEEIISGVATGGTKSLLVLDSLWDIAKKEYPMLKYASPKTKMGKRVEFWTDFAGTMINPISPYKLLPGDKIVKGLANKTKAFKIADTMLRSKLSPKILPHAYRIMNNSLRGGVNMPLITLVDKTVKATTDRDFSLKRGKDILKETGGAIVPGMIFGALIPEAGRGLKIGAEKLKYGFLKKVVPNRRYKNINPIGWATEVLKVKNPRDFKNIKSFYRTSKKNYLNSAQIEQETDMFREINDAYNILAVMEKAGIQQAAKMKGLKTPLTKKYKPIKSKKPQLKIDIVPLQTTTKSLDDAVENIKDVWSGDKDIRIFENSVVQRRLQKDFLKLMGTKRLNQKGRDTLYAMLINIDTRRNPAHTGKYWKKLNKEQQKIVMKSKTLSKKELRFADKLNKLNQKLGQEAKDAGIIGNVIENHQNRVWDLGTFGINKKTYKSTGKYKRRTGHRLKRKYNTIIEGWADGGELKVKDPIISLKMMGDEYVKSIHNKEFMTRLSKLTTPDGRPLLTSFSGYDDYKRIDNPQFRKWETIKSLKKAVKKGLVTEKLYNAQGVIIKKGVIYQDKELYAPIQYARNLNNMLGTSLFYKHPVSKGILKYENIIKNWVLQSSFFHHLAYMRSYWLGTSGKSWKELNPKKAYKQGIKAIEQQDPLIRLGIKKGLTLGLRQDWEVDLITEKTIIGKWLDGWKVSKYVKDNILKLRDRHANFLFGEFGAGLKAKAYLIELRRLQKKYPKANLDELAKLSAELINNDFGGLHLERMGRNPTVQSIFRMFSLAPDWTESNVKTMTKLFKVAESKSSWFAKTDYENEIYRHFWANVLSKGVMMSVLGNILLNGKDTPDVYKRAWQEGHMYWLDIDVTNLYKLVGSDTEERKYLSVLGHFKDPFKFMKVPTKSAKYKTSYIGRMFFELLQGTDWAGRSFTSVPEILGIDYDKGYYKKSRKGFHVAGEPKWGKHKGKTTKWDFHPKPVTWETFPSFMLNHAVRVQPVQIQNLVSWWTGEQEGIDAFLNSAGLQMKTTFGGKAGAKRKGYVIPGEKKLPKELQPEGGPLKLNAEYKELEKKKISAPTIRKILKMSPEEKKKYFKKKKGTKFIKKSSNEEYAQKLIDKQFPQMTELQQKEFTSLTNQFQIKEKRVSNYYREKWLNSDPDALIKGLRKLIKKQKKKKKDKESGQ